MVFCSGFMLLAWENWLAFFLVDLLLKKNSKNNFLITTVTLSSFNELNKIYKNNNRIFHQFLPYDSNLLINNFFKNWNPDLVSFVDSEIWPNFFLKIKKENLPFILLNARITKKSFDRWSLVRGFASNCSNLYPYLLLQIKKL